MNAHRSALSVAALTVAGVLTLAACDGGAGAGDRADGGDGGGFLGFGGEQQAATATLTSPAEVVLVPGSSAPTISSGASRALFEQSPVVVVVAPDEQLRGASAAAALGVPVLVDGDATAAEVERLGAEVALTIGAVHDPGVDVVAPADDTALAELIGTDELEPVAASEAASRVAGLAPGEAVLLVPDGAEQAAADDAATTSAPASTDATTAAPAAPLESDRDELPDTSPASPTTTVLVAGTGDDTDLAALGTARAAGARVLVTPHTSLGGSTESVEMVRETDPSSVIGLGDPFVDEETLGWQVRTAETGILLPGGGQVVLPGKTYVALYGTPGTGSLGVLGEQGLAETVARAEEHAGWYTDLTPTTVVPTLEIIATVASDAAGPDGNYSNELPVEQLEPLVDLAGKEGLYVVLDLQPGRSHFADQAKLYQSLLEQPHVGLALDPEWRLRPDQLPLQQIGQVDVEEVQQVHDWLADLVREHDLPQKALVLHQFQTRMLTDVDNLERDRSEVAVVIHVDGQGDQAGKQTTWRTMREHAPSVDFWGWKNFYDEDAPTMLTPEETMSQVQPVPSFISYQ